MSLPGPTGSAPPSGRSSAMKIVLIVLAVLALGCGGLCAGCIYVASKGATEAGKAINEVVKMSGAYLAAENAVTHDPQVIERLGEPITKSNEPKRQSTGELKPAGETFQFDVKGPKGVGIVSAVATAPDKTSPFKVTKITVTFADGVAVEVQPPGEQSDPFELKIEGGNPK